ncbi:RRXRR domain-containing protein [Nitrosococcus oceani]|uniref:RRXRR domain-containing protein n=1 Tax=Nitrosococcus oceani TaxID=1229 RepID=UPI000690CCAF|nr:RRXRR domain-containing protein [Nitrosococcus oceani]
MPPTKRSRTRHWVREGKATPFWKRGVFCVRLNAAPWDRELQPIAVGIDPGNKKEGCSVKADAVIDLGQGCD